MCGATGEGGGGGCRAFGHLGAVVGRDAVDDAEADLVPLEGNGELVVKDVILRFEVRRLEGEDLGERRRAGMSGEKWMGAKDLGQAGGGEWVFGGYVDGGAGEAMRRRKLAGE